MPPKNRFPDVFLVELLDAVSGELLEADVCARLESAIERVYWHLAEYKDSLVSVDVSYDDENALEGVAFFTESQEMLACISVYRLDRDTQEPEVAEIADACNANPADLQTSLNRIFRN